MIVDWDDLITLEQAGELVGRAPVSLRQAITRGRLPAVKVGKAWITTPEAVASYVALSREWRRPRGSAPLAKRRTTR